MPSRRPSPALILLLGLAAWLPLVAADADATTTSGIRRVYLANDDHTDFMWTADADTYARTFVEMLDFHLDLADQTAGNAPPYRDRFNADGSCWLWTYEQRKPPAAFARLLARIKDGTITFPLNTVVSCYGGQPVEAVLRGMYYAGRMERRHGVRFPLALAMEDQTLPLGLASLFAGAGARYTWRGVCGCASKLPDHLLGERPCELYWYTGLDGQRLLMKWYSLSAHGIGTYLEAGSPRAALAFIDHDPDFRRHQSDPLTGAPYQAIGLFGFGGDDLGRKTGIAPPPGIPGVPGLHQLVSSPACDHFHVIAEQLSSPTRQIIVSNEVDFFEDFARQHGASLGQRAVTQGNEWDLYSASMAETSARAKRAVEALRPAELLAALVSLKYPRFLQNHLAARDRAFNALGLYWEHNWTADGPVSRPQRAAWQEQVVGDIEYHVASLIGEGTIRLGGMIARPPQSNRFFVLNPLGWPRSDAADFRYGGPSDIHVRDVTSGRDVPHQFVHPGGARHLRILASEVPAAGYKVFEILPGAGTAADDDAATVSEDGATLANDAVRVVIARDGAIRSLVDRTRGDHELAGDIAGLRLNDLAAASDEGEPLRVVERGPVSVTVRARSEAGLAHTSEITLVRGSARVGLRNEISANFSDLRYWSFSTTLDAPAVHCEEVGAIILDKRQADGGHYADTHARYDHVSVNHFADLSDGAGRHGLTISNPDLAFAKLGASTVGVLDTATPQLHLLAGGQVDGRALGIQDQNGQDRFLQRFALQAHGAYDQVAAMRFALEHQNPLRTGAVISKGASDYPADSFSLVAVSDPRLLLWAFKVADEGIGHGLVARLWNVADEGAEGTLTFVPGLAAARRTTHIETDLEAVPLDAGGGLPMHFARQQIQTYRLMPAAAAVQGDGAER